MCTTYRELILPGTLSHRLFDRGDLPRCYIPADADNLDERAVYRLTTEAWRGEYAKARWALAEQVGALAGRDLADSLDARHLRNLCSSPTTSRLSACQVAQRYGIVVLQSNSLRDTKAYGIFVESFVSALIDAADDVRYAKAA